MNKLGYIYTTTEINSDGTELKHDGLNKLGIGKTIKVVQRFKQHHSRGSKASVGVKFSYEIDCDEIGKSCDYLESTLHSNLKSLGFYSIDRISIHSGVKKISTTEVFSGKATKEINGVVSIGEELSDNLIKKIILNISNIDLLKSPLVLLPHQGNKEFYLDKIKNISDRELRRKVLRFYEKFETTKEWIEKKFKEGVKEILINHKPRSGKSFVCYDYLISNKPKNVLLLTQYPILNNQWESEFIGLRGHDYNIIISNNVENIVLDETKPNFVMISLQDAKGSDVSDDDIISGLKKQKFSQIVDIDWDLIIFDEVHKGKETPKTDKLLVGLKYHKMIALTATATKNLLRGSFSKDNIHKYQLLEENNFKKYFPELYKNPNITHLLFNIDDDVKSDMDFFTKNELFNFKKFLEVPYSLVKDENQKDKKIFDDRLVYENDIKKLFSWFFCKGRYNKKSNSSFKYVNKSQSILLFVDNNECQSKIKNILEELVGDVYDVYFTNSNVMSSQQLSNKIKTEYVPKNGKKTIVIANKQLTTGVTLKYCDMVIFMNDWKSIDEYIQASYRCQSPSDNKEECYVVDLNSARAYTILHSYIESNSTYKNEDINKSISEYLDCANIFESFGKELKQIDLEGFKNRVVNFSGIDNRFFPPSINNSDSEVLKEKERLLSFGDLESGIDNSKTIVKLDDDSMDSGKTKKSNKSKGESKKRESDEYKSTMEKLLKNRDFFRERLPILSLTTKFNYDNIDTIFDILDDDDYLISDFLNNLLIETLDDDLDIISKDTLYQVVKDIYKSNIFNKSAMDYRILIFNEKFKSLFKKYDCPEEKMRNIEEIYELITSYLGVSQVEKKKNGEVFTPFELINEILDTLPSEVWSNPELKWLDPANGIGNFPAVVISRLMKGLEYWENDTKKRYKHILENMIYICDISPKNMFLYLNIFDPNNEYKMNFLRDSFLDDDKLNTKDWGLFDIIIGNPPYNDSEGIKGGCKNLYQPFILKSLSLLKKDGYLSFLTPPGFYKTTNFDEPNNIFKKITTDKSLIYLNSSDIQNKYFKVGSLIVYYLIKNEPYSSKTIIESESGKFEVNISEYNFIPRIVSKESYSILNKITNKGIKLDVYRDDHKKIKVENFVTLSTLNHLNENGKWNAVVGNEENRARIIIKHDDPNELLNTLSLKLYRFIFVIYRHDGAVYHNFIKGFRIPENLYKTDIDIYKYFNLDEEEIEFIEKTIKD